MTARIGVRLDDEARAWLIDFAQAHEMKYSDVIRTALAAYRDSTLAVRLVPTALTAEGALGDGSGPAVAEDEDLSIFSKVQHPKKRAFLAADTGIAPVEKPIAAEVPPSKGKDRLAGAHHTGDGPVKQAGEPCACCDTTDDCTCWSHDWCATCLRCVQHCPCVW